MEVISGLEDLILTTLENISKAKLISNKKYKTLEEEKRPLTSKYKKIV